MEKDNKKARDDARKAYNETVRVSPLFLGVKQLICIPVTGSRAVHSKARPQIQVALSESKGHRYSSKDYNARVVTGNSAAAWDSSPGVY